MDDESLLAVISPPCAEAIGAFRHQCGHFGADVYLELLRADGTRDPLNSYHEAAAVIREEFEEFWDEVKRKAESRDTARIRAELVQVAAMCWRTARNLGIE